MPKDLMKICCLQGNIVVSCLYIFNNWFPESIPCFAQVVPNLLFKEADACVPHYVPFKEPSRKNSLNPGAHSIDRIHTPS